MLAILKKEIKGYFYSPIGYVYIGLFLIMASLVFYSGFLSYGLISFENLFGSLSLILTFITPLITMRMFAEEKKNGTEQLLFTSPVSMPTIVLGKFLSAIFVLIISTLFTFIYYFILARYGTPYFPTVITTMLGFILLGIAYISFGMFASSITENQIIAAIITVAFFILSSFMPAFNPNLESFSLPNMFYKFPSGQIALNEVVTYISFILLFTILTMIVLQRKKSLK